MKKFYLLIFVFVLIHCPQSVNASELINIDFTRDSTVWKSKFPKTTRSVTQNELFAQVSDKHIDNFSFNGDFGKFNADAGVRAQPVCSENLTIHHTWAFRINNTGASNIELPRVSSAGKLTIFCKNSNEALEDTFYIQKKSGKNWETIRTIFLPPHYDQNYEQQSENYLDINSSVELRIAGATRNTFVYAVRLNSYDASEPKEKPLRLILLPDPQTYVKYVELNPVYGAQTSWINNNADSISFVLCQGDITGGNKDEQWKVAAGAFTILEGRKIPFTFCAGNHDLGKMASTRNTGLMNSYLPFSRYSRYPSFGGAFEVNKMDNTWHVFSKGDYKFLILSLEFVPRNKVIDWAKIIIEQHPNHNVIINTHAYLKANNLPYAGEIEQEIGKATGDEFANNGLNIWEKLVSQYPNCLFVFNGHVTGKGIGHLVSSGKHGNQVYQFLANYQGGVDGTQEERNGMLRIVDLNPEKGTFTIQTYSPYTRKYNTANGQHFFYENVHFIKASSY